VRVYSVLVLSVADSLLLELRPNRGALLDRLGYAAEAHMTVRDLETLYDYNYWANAKLFDPLSRLTPEELVRTVAVKARSATPWST
jgi:hypothetical protein